MSELKIDVYEIKNEAYAQKDFDLKSNIGEVELRGQTVDLGEVKVAGNVSNTTSGILLKAKVAGLMGLSCTRCLNRFSHPLNLEIEEFYDFADNEAEHKIEDNQIDLKSLIIEVVALNLDMKVLCKKDCAGLCPKCGTDLNKEQCKCETSSVDIRWNKLQELKKKLEPPSK